PEPARGSGRCGKENGDHPGSYYRSSTAVATRGFPAPPESRRSRCCRSPSSVDLDRGSAPFIESHGLTGARRSVRFDRGFVSSVHAVALALALTSRASAGNAATGSAETLFQRAQARFAQTSLESRCAALQDFAAATRIAPER